MIVHVGNKADYRSNQDSAFRWDVHYSSLYDLFKPTHN